MRKLYFVLACIAIASCKKDETVPDLGYGYYPAAIGTYVVYDVDSFVYNDFTHKIDTFQFQVKEIIDSSFIFRSPAMCTLHLYFLARAMA